MKNLPQRSDDDMIESASVTALMRYLLSNKKGLTKNPDNLGKYFINGKWLKYLDNIDESIKELQDKLPGCIYYHLVRTRKFDDSLLEWMDFNPNSQIVNLGAGFDSRSIRFAEKFRQQNVTLYEVDLKAMMEYKKKIIQSEFDISLDYLCYVPCNFQVDNVIEKLLKYGFKTDVPTLILWEGVTYFLSQDIFERYLKLFQDNLKSKFQITFDYAFKDYVEGDLNFYGAKELYDILVELGEPHLFGINYNDVNSYFKEKGFIVLSNNTSLMLEALYLKDSYGKSAGMPHVFHAIAEISNQPRG